MPSNKDYDKVMGDIIIKSNNPILDKMKLSIKSMAIIFSEEKAYHNNEQVYADMSEHYAQITAQNGLVLRKNPGVKYKKITNIPYMEKVKVLDKNGFVEDWDGCL